MAVHTFATKSAWHNVVAQLPAAAVQFGVLDIDYGPDDSVIVTAPPEWDAALAAADPNKIDLAPSREAIILRADAIINAIIAAYPRAEIISWSLQASQAQTVLSGGALPPDALLAGMAADAGQGLSDYAAGVRAKQLAFEGVVRALKKMRDAAETALAAATTMEQRDSALAAALATMDQIAAAAGVA